MSTRNCRRCNQPFTFDPAYPHAQFYCSVDCYQEHRREKREEFLNTGKTCERCGNIFYPKRDKNGRSRSLQEFKERRFCGRECAGEERRNNIENVLQRIVINQTTGCHIWTGPKNLTGYGQVRLDNRTTLVHRAVWEHHKGPIPEDMQIDHMCMVRSCCNVDHLRMVTARENVLANTCNSMGAQNARKTECSTCGGPFSFRPNGYRYCRPCWLRSQKEAIRRYRARPGVNAANVARYRAKKKQEKENQS